MQRSACSLSNLKPCSEFSACTQKRMGRSEDEAEHQDEGSRRRKATKTHVIRSHVGSALYEYSMHARSAKRGQTKAQARNNQHERKTEEMGRLIDDEKNLGKYLGIRIKKAPQGPRHRHAWLNIRQRTDGLWCNEQLRSRTASLSRAESRYLPVRKDAACKDEPSSTTPVPPSCSVAHNCPPSHPPSPSTPP